MAARMKEGSAEGLYVASHGGHNAESHNHNDVGDFIVYAGGKPVIIDVGVETYSAKTFSSQRYDIWTMQSAFHNLPTIDGAMQEAGREFAARDVAHRVDDAGSSVEMEIGGAWAKTAGVRSWKRSVRLDRGRGQVEVRDRYALAQAAREITLTLMTPWRMREAGAGEIALKPEGGPEVRIAFDAKVFRATQEEIPITDGRLRGAWGERLYRILLHAQSPGASGDWALRVSV
jgi:hypothetical protein